MRPAAGALLNDDDGDDNDDGDEEDINGDPLGEGGGDTHTEVRATNDEL